MFAFHIAPGGTDRRRRVTDRGGALADISLQTTAKTARRGRGRPFAKANPAILPAPAFPRSGHSGRRALHVRLRMMPLPNINACRFPWEVFPCRSGRISGQIGKAERRVVWLNGFGGGRGDEPPTTPHPAPLSHSRLPHQPAVFRPSGAKRPPRAH